MTMLTLSALLWASGLPPFETEFQSLFDGQTLKGWMGDTTGYVVRDGAITVTPQGRNLYTAEEYADFILRFARWKELVGKTKPRVVFHVKIRASW